jgi:glycosyltransferase involved in cell wall biosynthesis
MTILQLISSEGFFGAESMLVTLAQSLARLGSKPIVGVFHDARNPHTEVAGMACSAGLKVRVIPCTGRWDRKAVGTIRALIATERVEVLHAHGYKADLYGYAATRSGEVLRVSTCHNWPNPKLLMQAYAKLDRLVLRSFDEVIAPCPEVLQILRRSGVQDSKLSWVNNGVDVEKFVDATPELRRELRLGERPVIGFVGRMIPEKGGATLLDAARIVLATNREAAFVFVGDGPSRLEWQQRAAEMGIGDNVFFPGIRTDMPAVYASLDVFVLPSFAEAMPMVLLEAMSAAKPVIATPVGSVSELVVPNENGFLCTPGDAAGLAQSILTFLADREQARVFGARGRTRAEQQFSSEAMTRKYLGLYERSLRRRSAGARGSSRELVA